MHTNALFAARKYTPISVSIIAVLVVAVYAIMFGNYRAQSGDGYTMGFIDSLIITVLRV